MTHTGTGGPAFTGLVLQEDRHWRYSFWYPKGWYRFDLGDERTGVLCSPAPENPTTFFSVQVAQLEIVAQAEDLPVLCEGVQEGLEELPEVEVESAQESAGAGRIEIERTYTFRDGEHVRKRRIRLIYDRDRLYSLMSQGATVQEYEYWLSMLNYCHLTFKVGLFGVDSLAESI
jgi:hypothetical protein